MNQYDLYLASGTLPEIFVNKFNYHGFRYIRITGLKEMPVADSIKAFLIHTDYKPASGFECSDPDMNRIHDMIWYTLQCLSLGGDLVDCPHLERLGYGGDGNASTLTAQTMFNLSPLYNMAKHGLMLSATMGVCHIPLQILIRPEEAPTGAVLLSRQHGTLF